MRNAYATCPQQENSPEKFGLMLHSIYGLHGLYIKATAVEDGHASY